MSGPILTGAAPRLPVHDIGWPLMPVPGEDGRLAWPDAAASVRHTIEAILRTAPGERLMRPRFGAGLEAMLHAPNTLTTRAKAHDAIVDAIRRYEPRIVLDRVDVDESPDPREVLVTIAYRMALTGEASRIEARVPVGGA